MSGYREHSFEPNHWEPMGPPIRPYNKVQWCGAGLIVIGFGIFLAYIAGRFGWTKAVIDDPMMSTSFMIFGMVLINTRRHPVAPELREQAKRRTMVALTIALVVAVIAAGIAIYVNRHGGSL